MGCLQPCAHSTTSCTSIFLPLKMSLSQASLLPLLCPGPGEGTHGMGSGVSLGAHRMGFGHWEGAHGMGFGHWSPLPSPKQKHLTWSESPKGDIDLRQGQPALPHPCKDKEIFPWCR